MRQYVAFPVKKDGGDVIVAEVAKLPDDTGTEPAALPDQVARKAAETFEAAVAKAKPIAQAVIATMTDVAEGVTEVQVEFGLKLSAEAGVILTSGGVEANFTVSVKWERDKANKGTTPKAGGGA
jgi:hypothetical protein